MSIAPPRERSLGMSTGSPGGSVRNWQSRCEWLDSDILLVHNALPVLPDLVAAASESHFKPASVAQGNTAYYDQDLRSSKNLPISGVGSEGVSEEIAGYAAEIQSVASQFVAVYLSENRWAAVSSSSGFELMRYDVGDKFGLHVDLIRNHAVLGMRRLSLVGFCNEGFDGGRLVFPRQEIEITAETGALVIFPSSFTHPHEVTEVTRGSRYSVVSWLY